MGKFINFSAYSIIECASCVVESSTIRVAIQSVEHGTQQVLEPVHQQSISLTAKGLPVKDSQHSLNETFVINADLIICIGKPEQSRSSSTVKVKLKASVFAASTRKCVVDAQLFKNALEYF